MPDAAPRDRGGMAEAGQRHGQVAEVALEEIVLDEALGAGEILEAIRCADDVDDLLQT